MAFCEMHPGLRAVSKVRQALGNASQPPPHPPTDSGATPEVEDLKSAARNLRVAADQNLQAALTAARLAEATARPHRQQLEQLALTIAAYDAILTPLTTPSTLND